MNGRLWMWFWGDMCGECIMVYCVCVLIFVLYYENFVK